MLEKIIFTILLFWLPFQLGRHFWPKESLLFGLRVDFLSPTFYLQDLLILILISINFYRIIKDNSSKLFKDKKYLILALLYLAFATLNTLFSATPLLSLFSWLRITEMVIFGLIVFRKFALIFPIFFNILPLSLFFEFVLSVFQVIRQSSTGIFWLFGERNFNIFTPGIARAVFLNKVLLRPYGTFSHPNSLAGFTLIAVIFLLGKGNLKLLEKIAVILGLILIILSFSRTVWLAAFILGAFYLFFKLKEYFKLKKLSLSYSYLLLIIFLPFIFFFYSKTSFDSSSFTLRRDLAAVSLRMISGSPLLGVGAGQFIIKLSQLPIVWPSIYWLQPVHNIYLLVASEIGLVASFIFIALIVLILKRLLSCYLVSSVKKKASKLAMCQTNNTSRYCLPLFIAMFAILFTGVFDHYWLTLVQNQLLFTLVLGLSFGVSGAKMKK